MRRSGINAFVLVAAIFITVLSVGRTYAVEAPELTGIWKCTENEKPIELTFFDDGRYQWGEERGRFQLKDDVIWLMTEKRIGKKWHIKIEENKMTLNKPEDFRYLGGPSYFYYQVTDASLEYHFNRTED